MSSHLPNLTFPMLATHVRKFLGPALHDLSMTREERSRNDATCSSNSDRHGFLNGSFEIYVTQVKSNVHAKFPSSKPACGVL